MCALGLYDLHNVFQFYFLLFAPSVETGRLEEARVKYFPFSMLLVSGIYFSLVVGLFKNRILQECFKLTTFLTCWKHDGIFL
jgi:hypothetical protein